MPLNNAVLKAAIEAAINASSEAAQQTPPPDPDELVSDLAQALADAIEAFVRGADVAGVETVVTIDTVNGAAATGSGTGQQDGTVQLQ